MSGTYFGDPVALLEIRSAALRLPRALGANRTLMMQPAPAGEMLIVQPSPVLRKSPALAPTMLTAETSRTELLVFVTRSARIWLLLPTVVVGKVTVDGLTLRLGETAIPHGSSAPVIKLSSTPE